MDFKYKGDTAVGSTWKRVGSIIIYNDLDTIPRVAFAEQHVVEIDGQVLTRDLGTLSVLVGPNVLVEAFPVLDADGEPTDRTATVADLAALLTSAYVHFADKRDVEEAEQLAELEREQQQDQVPEEEEGSVPDPEESEQPVE